MLKESKTLEYKKEMSDTFLKTVSTFVNFGTETITFKFHCDEIIN